jgi:putative sigma-54 modulation protein
MHFFRVLPKRFSETGRSIRHDGGAAGTEHFDGAHGGHGDTFWATCPHPNPKRPMNNHNQPHEVIVSGIHLDLTPSLKTYVQEKVQRLFRHEERIVRLRVELECDTKQAISQRFTAKGHIQIHGPDMNAHVTAEEGYKAVDFLVDKLDRMLSRRSSEYKQKRKHPHNVEWTDVELPKAV